MTDIVNHPPHYTSHPSGVECIQITEHMSFNLGSAFKYIWRADEKGRPLEDLEKAAWYIQREIDRRTRVLQEEGTERLLNINGALEESFSADDVVLYTVTEAGRQALADYEAEHPEETFRLGEFLPDISINISRAS